MKRYSRRQIVGAFSASALGMAATVVLGGCDGTEAEPVAITKLPTAPPPKAEAPSSKLASPSAEEERPINVVNPQTGLWHWRQPNAYMKVSLLGYELTSAASAAARELNRRFSYPNIALELLPDSRWSYSTELSSLASEEPAILAFDQIDFADLATRQRLVPLTEFLQNDPDFDAESYWPGVLSTGQHDGVQYALPVAVAPWVTMFHEPIADAAGVEAPSYRTFDQATFLQAAKTIHSARPIPGHKLAVGFNYAVTEVGGDSADFEAMLPAHVLLHSAHQDLLGPDRSLDPLRSAGALETVKMIDEMVNVHGFTLTEIPIFSTLYWQNMGMHGWMLRGNDTSAFNWGSVGKVRIYPFPVGSGGVRPAEVWAMLGISATVSEPDLIYEAFSPLVRELKHQLAFPAVRTTPEDVSKLLLIGTPEEHALLVENLGNSSFIKLSRRERGILTNAIDGGIVHGGKSAEQALEDAIIELEALP